MAKVKLRNRITSQIRAPFDGIGKLDVTLDHDGKCEVIKVDDEWLKKEKTDRGWCTFQINNFGRVILYSDRDEFDKAAERFRLIVEQYQVALRETLRKSRSAFENRIVDEFFPRWGQNPPKHFSRWGIEVTSAKIRAELQRLAQGIFVNAVSFDAPVVKILYKNVAPENLGDKAFLEVLKTIMLKKRVPREIINSLIRVRASCAGDRHFS